MSCSETSREQQVQMLIRLHYNRSVNVVPLRVKVNYSSTVQHFLQAVQEQQIEHLLHESLDTRDIIRQCTDWPDWHDFGTCVNYINNMPSLDPVNVGDTSWKYSVFAKEPDVQGVGIVYAPKGDGLHLRDVLQRALPPWTTGQPDLQSLQPAFKHLCR